jgi:DNA-directed RNA polymerase specialized sigma24 family protein
MLAEKEALLVAGLDEFGGSELRAQEQVNTDLASRAASGYPYEASLIARMKSGDLSAFDDIVEQFQPMVYMLSLRVLADPEDARDATQESFLKVYRHIGGFRGEASLKTWICRIAINQARSMERWWRRRPKTSRWATAKAVRSCRPGSRSAPARRAWAWAS